ncbi:DgyrCDS9392 [Dimorphilus gyrociliatus]|uniref:ADP-ribosyl cyclase/cyclic ADP-ribose hydrolase n=1 Tax=Dimorphilus gyrociliatus TaxID=2664684 RepID=A0A7I8VWV4_9ANNE|nr:DgyrCDS9392 [Dimorphilus gyrociliatus]
MGRKNTEKESTTSYSWQRSQSELHLDNKNIKSTDNVSQHSRVYWDLSRSEEEGPPKFKVSLQTIKQKEEISGCISRRTASMFANYNPASPNVQVVLRNTLPIWKKNVLLVRDARSDTERVGCLEEMHDILVEAWSLPIVGKEFAHGLCDALRTSGGVHILLKLCSQSAGSRLHAAKLLEQSMTLKNCDVIVDEGLNAVVELTAASNTDTLLQTPCTGILEHLFKHSELTCAKLVQCGGLNTLLNACKTSNTMTLRHCAKAFANLAMYGDNSIKNRMIELRVPNWLFPLAFNDDDSIRYYAFLAIETLAASHPFSPVMKESGTLELVQGFIETHDPSGFAFSDTAHIHGHTDEWMRKLVPLLTCQRPEAQSLAAFHFAVEAAILVRKSDDIKVIEKIGAIPALKKVAGSCNKLAAKFALQALEAVGVRDVPNLLPNKVAYWSTCNVVQWLQLTGFSEFIELFEKEKIDGDLLLRLDDDMLRDGLGMNSCFARIKFLKALKDLKIRNELEGNALLLEEWLKSISEDLAVYAYQMDQSGVDKQTLCMLTDEHLYRDCHITNGIDRLKIMDSLKRRSSFSMLSIDNQDSENKYDVFISYRRKGGSLLASLLKVHLQVRGYRVFLDIEKLQAGKFDEKLLDSVRGTRHFLLILTPEALERCIGDDCNQDWIHREITAAIDAGRNIIPIEENFKWPQPECLPSDMKAICSFNSIRWIHDYQDACVEKIIHFMNNEGLKKSSELQEEVD